ncbi:phage baseplate plug family protein [Fusobacterium mortiferum]|uniref:Cyanophage baseplate Pam3 plug gp18 domain-containing protein n=1 Tax=Fusobacterium mortiferum TaxID=850 RepID=A0ABS2G2V0_FUSMR|nr:hypothetical protein [Fusobacterium mortiferum]MBM6875759.1 hypothetical protein [Fusobacterium mortiferum]
MRFQKKEIERIVKIFKEDIPYSFELKGFTFTLKYNDYNDGFYILCKTKEGEILGAGDERLVLDFPVFWQFCEDYEGNRDSKYPSFNLVPRSIDMKDYEVNWENLNEFVFLAYEEVE